MRDDQTWTVDGDGRYAYLFAGRNGAQILFDLWQYDLQADTWTLLSPKNNPKPRFGHAAAWVPNVGLVIFGGQSTGGQFFNDIWAYSPETNTWTQLPSKGNVPQPRYGTCAGLAPDGTFWISHGFSDLGRMQDTAAYDFSAMAWDNVTSLPAPEQRCLHDCAWSADGQFLLYGGQATGVAALGDLWSRPVDGKWAEQAQPPLAARQQYSIATVNNVAWIFGGADVDLMPLDDVWTLDMGSFEWTQIKPAGNGPSPRLAATLIADPVRSRLLLFGGKNAVADSDELWSLALQ